MKFLTASCLYQRWFPQDLKWVGLLAPLDAPHHLRKHEHLPYREGSARLGGQWRGQGGQRGAMGGNGGRKALATFFFFFFFFCFFFFFLLHHYNHYLLLLLLLLLAAIGPLQEWCCRRVGQRRQRMRKVPG